MSDIVWEPGPDLLQHSNVARFAAEHGIDSFDALRGRSIAEPEWFWDAMVRFLGLEWDTPYTEVLDVSRGIPWATWFTGGKLNLATNCVDRHAVRQPDTTAVVWEGEDGDTRTLSYRELQQLVDRIATALTQRGITVGDAVGIFLPMIPETAAALLAVAKIGAIFLPIFSGYASEAIAIRLQDAEAKAIITADGFWRRGTRVNMKETADAAADLAPTVHTVVVVERLQRDDTPWNATRDVKLSDVAPPAQPLRAASVDSEHVLFLAYTSGTTGRPKGSVHVHGGFLAKIAEEVAMQFDLQAGRDTLFWFTDMGWIMGPWEVVGTLANGGTVLLYEGAPDFPTPARLWQLVERHRVTILGLAPTLVRALMAHGGDVTKQHDLSSLRILGSTGEPWNEGPWRWYFEYVGGGRCPIINISGGTEVGACFLSPHVVQPLSPCSLGGPSLGMAVDVFDNDGKPIRGEVGELVCTKPWPGMTRGIWRDPHRYLDTYWSRWPDVWQHGDWASVSDDGQWFLHGRSDDTIKVAGKRLGPAEVETVLVEHPAVVEAAAVGLPDDVKGEALYGYVVLAPDAQPSEALRSELVALVTQRLGKSFKPSGIRFTVALPKTRNAKVLRRAIRAVATGNEPGDLSGLEDPSTLTAVAAAQ